MSCRLSVFVAAYNEAENIEAALDEIAGVLHRCGATYELVVVDDGSTDNTAQLAEQKLASIPHSRLHRHPHNQGLGGFYRTAIREARGQLLTFFPADGQFPPTIIEQYLPYLDTHDIVVGYVGNRNDGPLRKALSGVERFLYQLMFGPLPLFQGIVMVRHANIAELNLVSTGRGWGVIFELIVKTVWHGWSLANLSIPLRPRWAGHSKVLNFRTIWANLREVFSLWFRLRGQRPKAPRPTRG